ncbi:MAG: DUF4339 domain-containing protein [Parvularculaceae bacterium]
MLAADNWCVRVDKKVYGPYSSSQLRKFVHEGRLAAWSLVSPAGSRAWREAREEPAIAELFEYSERSSHFGRLKPNGDSREARRPPEFKPDINPARANFIIIFDVVSASASRVEAAILSLGSAFRVADNVWTLQCELTAVGVRNALAPYLKPREPIFVVDATRGRTAWQNFTPELHAKLGAAWLQVTY